MRPHPAYRWLFSASLLLAFDPGAPAPVRSQERPQPSRSIDLDRELRGKVPQDRAASYYRFSLAKWFEEKGDISLALSEMRKAVAANESSSSLRVELAGMLAKTRNFREAIEECQEAIRIDSRNAEAYWLLAYIYDNTRERLGGKDSIRRAVKELETMRDVAPDDERSYYALGRAYFELEEPEKAIQAYEKFQSLRPDSDVGYTAIAEYFQKQGDDERAIEYLSKALKAQPESIKSMMMLASVYAKSDKSADAIPVYRKILKLTGENPTVKRQLAASLLDVGEYTEAEQLLEDLVKASGRDSALLTQLGRARLASRQIPRAIESFEAALEENPGNLEAEFYLGTCHEQSGNPAKAAEIYSGLLEKTKSQTGSYTEEQKGNRAIFQQRLAAAYQEMGEVEKAIGIYEGLVQDEASPSSHQLFLLINAYRMNRQFDKAIQMAKQHYEKNPADSQLGLVYARTLADAGKTEQGADILQKLLQLEPFNLDIYLNLSQVYLQGKRYSDAEKVLHRAQALDSLKDPDGERVKFQLAALYERQQDFERAETLFKEILNANPEHASALNYIGYMLADRGIRLQEAVDYVERALAIEPNNGAYLDSLGWAFYKLNDLGRAEQFLLKAVAVVKNDPTIHEHLGDLYHKNGDYQKALEYWGKSITHGTEPEEIQKVREKLQSLKDKLLKQPPPQ